MPANYASKSKRDYCANKPGNTPIRKLETVPQAMWPLVLSAVPSSAEFLVVAVAMWRREP